MLLFCCLVTFQDLRVWTSDLQHSLGLDCVVLEGLGFSVRFVGLLSFRNYCTAPWFGLSVSTVREALKHLYHKTLKPETPKA